MALIEIDALTVKYARRKLPALRGLSLHVEKGETLLLLGPSGSGKSTLGLTLNGLIPQSVGELLSGTVRVNGFDTQEHDVAELAQQVGILFQDPDAQFATLKVEDEIVFGLENLRQAPESMDAKVEDALGEVGMLHARQRPVTALSGGEKQRVALASLLAMRPSVLVFDEPTANLDSIGTQQIFALLAELKSRGQHTLILIEHKLDELMHLVDRVVVLDSEGGILVDGAPRQLFDERGVELRKLGVWMPQVCLLAHALRENGVPLASFPITLGEAVKALRIWLIERNVDLTAVSANTHESSPQKASEAVFHVRDLSFAYGETPALSHVSLQVRRGDFLAIVGANGAGKTTLVKHLIGILQPSLGAVYFNGEEFTHIPAKNLAQNVGYVFQNPEHQFVTETVFDEIAYGLRVMEKSESEIQAKTQELLDTFGLTRYAKANPFTLSYGEKRRLSVASMLAMGQDTLILDEPTFGQDERNANALLDLLQKLNKQGKTIIVITHDMRMVAEYAQHVIALSAGSILFDGQPSDLIEMPDVLAKAHLNLPPLARLAALLSTQFPALRGWTTLNEFRTLGAARELAKT
jgi:energy-coupling factor transport system ATP-binding protein